MNETKELTPEQKNWIEELHEQVIDQMTAIGVDLIKFRVAQDSEVDALTNKIVKGIEGYVNLRIEIDHVLRGVA